MAAINMNFRSALNGFNRTDVVQFLQGLTTEHERELRSIQEENARLQEELSAVRAEAETAAETAKAETEAAKAEGEAARAEVEAAKQALAEKCAELDETKALMDSLRVDAAKQPALDAPMSPASLSPTPPSDFNEMELAAYRRAEMTERIARERAAASAERLKSVFAQAEKKLNLAGQDFSVLLDAFRNDFDQLQQVLCAAQGIVCESSESLKVAEELCTEL